MSEGVKEIKTTDLDPEKFIEEKTKEISDIVGDGVAINALSGGVDSSVVTVLGYRALGDRNKTYFVDNGLMRQDEPEQVVAVFQELEIPVEKVDAKEQFFAELKGKIYPEDKREAVRQAFYKYVFYELVKKNNAKYLLQGTILTDIDETKAGLKTQHNIFEQIGIDPQEAFGYKILEPLKQIRKDGVRKVAEALGLPESVYDRIPFPGPALATRIIGEVTPENVPIVRKATSIVEYELGKEKESGNINPFQYMAILHEDRVTGMRDGKRDFGLQIEVRCWDSIDARTATPTRLPDETLERLGERIPKEVPGVVHVTYGITPKPPSTMEAI